MAPQVAGLIRSEGHIRPAEFWDKGQSRRLGKTVSSFFQAQRHVPLVLD